jgi:hypothetical protein
MLCVTALLLCAAGALADAGATVRELIENQRRILILREAVNQWERAEARSAEKYTAYTNRAEMQKVAFENTQILPKPVRKTRRD